VLPSFFPFALARRASTKGSTVSPIFSYLSTSVL